MTADAAGSAGAILAGVAVLAFGASWADPTASILIGLLVIASAWGLLRDTTNVLLEGAPRGVDMDALEAALVAQPGVTAVHHLHVWELASDLPALSVHVVLDGEPTLHDAQTEGDRLRAMLASEFGIEHATLELECHDCEGAVHSPAPRGTVEGTRGPAS
jgi:cobalt-zinc-cadmium efflux system protein